MEVNIKQAQKIFFSKSSFEMIFNEAFVNALDAGADHFIIDINLPDWKQLHNLSITMSDNGEGFTDNRFDKFSKLLDVEERTHKGLGRLVYLCYFDKVNVESIYESVHKRTFTFSEEFNKENKVSDIADTPNGTILKLHSFNGRKLGRNDYINPVYIKNSLLETFYMKFYKAKKLGKPISVSISLSLGGVVTNEEIKDSDLPKFEVLPIEPKLDLYNSLDLYFNITEVNPKESKVITAIGVDDRCQGVDIIANENLPVGYRMIFLLISDTFLGNVDSSRQTLTIEESELSVIKSRFRSAIASVIKKRFPIIQKRNERSVEYLNSTYPFLTGYFDVEEIGYSSQVDILKKAQDKFFREQKDLLGAQELSDDQYRRTIDMSARALAQYILFRQSIIDRLKKITPENVEEDIHNIIAPKRTEFKESNFIADLYKNNVWVLDDKFMSYRTVLSEKEMITVVDVLTEGEDRQKDSDRPDIVLYFSGDPNISEMVDVVIVELKRTGLSPERNSDVEIQLETRAKRLSKYYNNKIQRVWYYGIVDLSDKEYVSHLRTAEFVPLFSMGKVYYKAKKVYLDSDTDNIVLANTFIMDFSALVNDAEVRNETFLKILKHQFEQRD